MRILLSLLLLFGVGSATACAGGGYRYGYSGYHHRGHHRRHYRSYRHHHHRHRHYRSYRHHGHRHYRGYRYSRYSYGYCPPSYRSYSYGRRSYGYRYPYYGVRTHLRLAPIYSRYGTVLTLDDEVFDGTEDAADADGIPQPRTAPVGARFLKN